VAVSWLLGIGILTHLGDINDLIAH